MDPPAEGGTVAVMVRVRPPAPNEREGAAHSVLHVVDQHILVFDPDEPGGPHGTALHPLPTRGSKQRGKDIKFVFDRVFGEGATQQEVFQHTTRDVLDGVLNGYNCSVFAYGATGAGKTYTMLGSEQSPGIMYLTMAELYRRIEARKDEKSCEVLVSYQEVYNEQIHDLLEPKGPLAIREDPEKGVVVQGLSFHQPRSAEQLLEMLANGNKNRTQHPTDANATSSRSHAVFQIYVKQQDRVVGLAQDLQVAKMSLIDLAGSERASVSKTKGERLREGANINRSLLALINVINALADAKSKKTHIPYRDSKLTRLLKDSIGGNCRTIMIAAVSPSSLAYEDTYNTLKYANRAKEIKLLLKSNVLSLDCHISKYATICEQLKTEVADLQAKLRAYEDAARDAGKQIPVLLPSPRMEGAVPKSCSAPSVRRESDGEQQELGAGQDAQGAVEEVLEAMPPSSSSPSQQADLQLGMKKPNLLPQHLSRSHTDRLIAAVLSVAQKQYSLLKAANLLTPAMVTEFEELQLLVQQEAAVSPQPTDTSGATPALRTQPGCDASPSVLSTESTIPMTRAALRRLQQLTSLPSPKVAVKKRRRSEMSSTSSLETPRSLNTRAKRQRKSSPLSNGDEAEAPWSPHTPCVKQPQSTQLLPSCTPKICPLTVTKGRAPLRTSAAQNCCTPTVCDLNVTYSLSEDVSKPGALSLPSWESAPCALKKQEGPFVPRTSIPVFSMKGSSIPKPSSISKGSVRKRRGAVSTASHSLGGVQSCISSSSSWRSVQPQSIPEHPPPGLTWKGRSGPRDGAPRAPTSQAMKLLC
ncbi:kinesin-like protein KIF18B [Coturnix japonica]|uniref:kinesin-like protein KIF18B n=1 Tax=Coturnix japonica TaxID=93934 RepID=UPI000776F70D|nr:kinesin-like protein KIF18B [Coturnix japonica]